jgi:hypothetical protein
MECFLQLAENSSVQILINYYVISNVLTITRVTNFADETRILLQTRFSCPTAFAPTETRSRNFGYEVTCPKEVTN